MRLPKITKYSVAVTVGGTMVWPQMRTMRLNSRMTMVREADPFGARARGCHAQDSFDGGADAVVDQTDEQFLEPIDLVAHAVHADSLQGKLRENIVQALPLRDLDLERVIVRETWL